MRRLVVFLCLAILLWHVQPAGAWDPDEREYPVIEPPEATVEKWVPEPTPKQADEMAQVAEAAGKTSLSN